MKRLLIVTFSVLCLLGCASQAIIPENERMYQEVIQFPELNSNQIYEKTLQAFAQMFVSSRAVIEYKNKDECKIIGNAIINVNYTIVPIPTHFNITIEIKDNRMRLTLTNIYGEMQLSGKNNRVVVNNRAQMEKFSEAAKLFTIELRNNIYKSEQSW